MKYSGREKIQLGEIGWKLGSISNLISGAIETDIFYCENCGKLEFFIADQQCFEDDIPLKECPQCKMKHDFDYPKCPYCGYKYH